MANAERHGRVLTGFPIDVHLLTAEEQLFVKTCLQEEPYLSEANIHLLLQTGFYFQQPAALHVMPRSVSAVAS